jgi:hypothetical protein
MLGIRYGLPGLNWIYDVCPFPFRSDARPPKSMRKHTGHSKLGHHLDLKAKGAFEGERSIVFVAGGVTYAEIRSAYEVAAAKDREVIIGGTCHLNPISFLRDLAALH